MMDNKPLPEDTIVLQTTLSSREPRQLHLHALDAGYNTLLDVTLTAEQMVELLAGSQVKTPNLAGTDSPFKETL